MYVETTVSLRDLKSSQLHVDLCQPFAAHCKQQRNLRRRCKRKEEEENASRAAAAARRCREKKAAAVLITAKKNLEIEIKMMQMSLKQKEEECSGLGGSSVMLAFQYIAYDTNVAVDHLTLTYCHDCFYSELFQFFQQLQVHDKSIMESETLMSALEAMQEKNALLEKLLIVGTCLKLVFSQPWET
ncbi:unnamed protein product [Clavelina lepadiformis]|uniref:Macoilin n=1 Tax=Clavelina lepadiformis TaxID=159417 RepID=A0ABP0EZE4_CLALP